MPSLQRWNVFHNYWCGNIKLCELFGRHLPDLHGFFELRGLRDRDGVHGHKCDRFDGVSRVRGGYLRPESWRVPLQQLWARQLFNHCRGNYVLSLCQLPRGTVSKRDGLVGVFQLCCGYLFGIFRCNLVVRVPQLCQWTVSIKCRKVKLSDLRRWFLFDRRWSDVIFHVHELRRWHVSERHGRVELLELCRRNLWLWQWSSHLSSLCTRKLFA